MERHSISIVRQLVKVREEALIGPSKNGKSSTILLDEKTRECLRKQKAAQAAQKLQLGTTYKDHRLVFARDFGQPLTLNNIGQREFARLIKLADVKTITVHDLPHTCATLALKEGVPVKVVSERLGHKRIEITLNVYAHALSSMQQEAAAKLGKLLHG